MARILIVDDEPGIRSVVSLLLTDRGHTVTEAISGEAAIELVEAQRFNIALVDFSLPGMNGIETLKRIRDRNASIACIVITAYGNVRNAIDAVRGGAADFLTKPFDNEELILAIDQALNLQRLSTEVEALRAELESRYGFSEIVGISANMREVFRRMAKAAASMESVLVLGESGTGKELVAQAIHRRSGRAAGPFVAVNCAAIPDTLIEAEFFGVQRGAFTDAKEARPGKFELANGGTLFLDEVGDLAAAAQAKVLRVLQNREITRLGSTRSLHVDVRVIAATNKDLPEEMGQQRFRDDLYYRLNVLTIRVPPLRERREDLPLLIDHFLHALQGPSDAQRRLTPEAKRLLLAHDWPGNVRDLENALRHALALADGATISAEDLPSRVRGVLDEPRARRLTLQEGVARAVERVERAMIMQALAESEGAKTTAAKSLGIDRKTLFNRMKEYRMNVDGADVDED
jgi:DNA-binding NtrC family response regulator